MILARILEHKKAELRHKQSRGYVSELKALIRDNPAPLGFAVTLDATRSPESPALIAVHEFAPENRSVFKEEYG